MLENLLHSSVRDLCWVMESPSLIADSENVVNDAECQSIIESNHEWLQQLDTGPRVLDQWIEQQHSSRLGYYFEQLVAFWLQQKIAPEHVTSHVRVFQNKRVLGEYDFLFLPPGREEIQHWETAIKFYLRFEDHDGHYHWYGPNPGDTLDNKLSRMLSHQLKLSEYPEAVPVLQQVARETFHLDKVSPVLSRAFFKGYLFYPSKGDWAQPSVTHPGSAPHHLRGWWTTMNDLYIPGTGSGVRYALLPRLKWLAPAMVDRVSPLKDPALKLFNEEQLNDNLVRHFDRSQQPVLVAVLALDENGRWSEQSRGFVVGTAWPRETD